MHSTKLKVLIGCEHTGMVRRAFRARGHAAWSCDLLPAADGDPHHIQQDVLDRARYRLGSRHLPPRLHLPDRQRRVGLRRPAVPRQDHPAGGSHRGSPPRGPARGRGLRKSVAGCSDSPIALENPVGHLSRAIGRPAQIIQPWHFGHDASKKTCLWLKGLPQAGADPPVAPRMVDGRPRWANQTDSGQNRLPPSEDRWALRAATYPGIAKAFAEQWG